jgi:DNA-binding NarL/FixJ family response regulator
MSPPSDPSRSVPIRVVLVEDHDMVAEAIALALQRTADIEVVAQSASLAAALAAVRRWAPDVVLLDRRLPDGDGVAAIGGLVAAAPAVRVLVLTAEAGIEVATRVARAGGAGLLIKSAGLGELESAVRRVAAGETVFSADLLGGMLDRLAGRAAGAGQSLTAREQETLTLMAQGGTTRAIGRLLGVADNTARNHVQRVLEKLGAGSKLEAIAIARREGLLD